MIKKLINFSKKSFKNYTGPDECFNKRNIIFGYNGKGKSSLANGIEEEYLKNGDKKNLRFYNKEYVKDNLLIGSADNSKIRGVIANFGKEDVNKHKSINNLKSKIIDVNPIIETAMKNLNEVVDECNKIFERKKGKVSIHKKSNISFEGLLSACKNIVDANVIKEIKNKLLSVYEDDVKDAKKFENDENKLLNYRGDNSLENERKVIEEMLVDELISIDKDEFNVISEIMLKKYENVNVPSDKVIMWIMDGLTIHDANDSCKFCGGKIDIEKINHNVKLYSDNEKQKDSQKLKNFNSKLDIINVSLEKNLSQKELLISKLGDSVKEHIDTIIQNKLHISECIAQINEKLDKMEVQFEFNNYYDNLNMMKNASNEIKRLKNELKEQLIIKENNSSALIKGSIGLEIIKNSLIESKIKVIGEKIIEYRQSTEKNREIQGEIEKLTKINNNTKDFAEFISDILSSLEINLKLDLENKDYIIKHSVSNETLHIDDVSEGEQNLLALLYFYYELFTDKEQKEFKNNIELIILDDPISSVDDVNRMYVLELVNKITNLKKDELQIFVFTHVWDDFIEMCYGKDKNQDFIFFEVKKDEKGSCISVTKAKQTPYKHNFKEIYDFSKKSNCNDLNDCEIYHYPNIMRKILEEYLSFKASKTSPTNNNRSIIKDVLCGDSPSSKDELELGVLLNVCNILSHKVARNPNEILRSAKFLMRKIESRDKLHYDAMKQ